MVSSLLSIFSDMASVKTQLITLISVIMRTLIPKIKVERIRGGTRQATTVHIIFSTVTGLFTWGDMETVRI